MIGPLGERPARHARAMVGSRARRGRGERLRRDRPAQSRCDVRAGLPALQRRAADRRPRGVHIQRRVRERGRDRAAADQVVLALGETREMSGEAAARSTIDLPGRQEELLEAIAATGKPLAVVLFNGRPLTLGDIVDDSPAILEAWFPGVQAGPAVADVVFGNVNPGGKLPVSLPAAARPGAHLLQPRADGPPVQPDVEVHLASPRHPELRAAVRVRLRPQLHDVRGLQPAAELVERARRTAASGPPST